MSGELFVVATPIGNLSDITLRAIETLRTVDAVACEDTRHTVKLLNHLGLHKSALRYDEHTHERASAQIIQKLTQGQKIALVTDAGTPGISDPGGRLVRDAIQAGIKVTPIPGASSVIAALSVSGFPSDQFVFMGFLPRKEGRSKRLLREAFGLGKTVAILESPHRVSATLAWVADVSPEASVVISREMTKIHEEHIRGPVNQVRKAIENQSLLGEVVITIAPIGS
jgi:16S rRNA (cytidine1402-2'-O)-methyltransferase